MTWWHFPFPSAASHGRKNCGVKRLNYPRMSGICFVAPAQTPRTLITRSETQPWLSLLCICVLWAGRWVCLFEVERSYTTKGLEDLDIRWGGVVGGLGDMIPISGALIGPAPLCSLKTPLSSVVRKEISSLCNYHLMSLCHSETMSHCAPRVFAFSPRPTTARNKNVSLFIIIYLRQRRVIIAVASTTCFRPQAELRRLDQMHSLTSHSHSSIY